VGKPFNEVKRRVEEEETSSNVTVAELLKVEKYL